MTQPSWTQLAQNELVNSRNYREFLLIELSWSRSGKGRPNFAEFARRAELASRSFVSDVVQGKKRITSKSLTNFKRGLRLTGTWVQLFELLVFLEETDIRPVHLQEADITNRIEKLRLRLRDKLLSNETPGREKSLNSSLVYDIYAALGSDARGASLSEISDRTRHPAEAIAATLGHLIRAGMVELRSHRYFVGMQTLDLEQLGNSSDFQKVFLDSLDRLKANAVRMADHPDDLFFHSVLSVESRKLPELKRKLRDVLYQWMDEHQQDDADAIFRITLGTSSPSTMKSSKK